jgi:MoaA/NifB/PqqE/SkfB family radical SAM enzyme
MIVRAKTDNLIQTRKLTEKQTNNTALNKQEMADGSTVLKSYPQRFVFEMTNACNLNCVMCGRNAKHFKPTHFRYEWLSKLDSIAENVEEVTLMGWGEPTMHPRFADFLKWANTHGLRKYFCTNGMRLGELTPAIFDEQVDVIAISIDAASAEKNNAIRRGADFDRIIGNLRAIVAEKKRLNTPYPYMNFVTTLMQSTLHEFPRLVELAADIGLDEAKGVFLTAFDKGMEGESLWDSMNEVCEVFAEAEAISEKTGVKIKVPHLRGEDPAGEASHKPCHTAWRDFFLGSDGFTRPCMSTPIKFFHIDEYDSFDAMWNSRQYQDFRKVVNDEQGMAATCRTCYQSSFANWNKKSSFDQTGDDFAPEWGK